MNRIDAERIQKSIFNNQPEENRLRPRNRRWNCEQADLKKKCKIFHWKKRLTDGDIWKRYIKEAKALTGL